MSDRLRDTVALLIAATLPLALGGLGSFATRSSLSLWYRDLDKPAWNPPDWVFGPVWTVLYVLMGIAAWTVWRIGWHEQRVRLGLVLFGVQLFGNLLWTWLFFGLRSPGLALAEIVVLWVLIVLTTGQFFRINRIGGVLLLPYLIWVSFASVLNAAVWYLNQ